MRTRFAHIVTFKFSRATSAHITLLITLRFIATAVAVTSESFKNLGLHLKARPSGSSNRKSETALGLLSPKPNAALQGMLRDKALAVPVTST